MFIREGCYIADIYCVYSNFIPFKRFSGSILLPLI